MQKFTSLAFETILIIDGKPQNIEYHQNRMNKTRAMLFGSFDSLSLELDNMTLESSGYQRCRVVYSDKIESISVEPYHKNMIKKLKIIHSDIDYSYKLVDRRALDELFLMRDKSDDILIVRDGMVTDTSIANVAFFDGARWITPKSPLLKGTFRARLLDECFLSESDIFEQNIGSYAKFAIMNALRGFEILDATIEA